MTAADAVRIPGIDVQNRRKPLVGACSSIFPPSTADEIIGIAGGELFSPAAT
jgi:hypothetical protein